MPVGWVLVNNALFTLRTGRLGDKFHRLCLNLEDMEGDSLLEVQTERPCPRGKG